MINTVLPKTVTPAQDWVRRTLTSSIGIQKCKGIKRLASPLYLIVLLTMLVIMITMMTLVILAMSVFL